MQRIFKAFNLMRLRKHPDAHSSQFAGTKSLNQSCQPSMAMGEVSIALNGVKIVHGTFILLLIASYHSSTVSLDPPDLSICSLCVLRVYPDHHCPFTPPILFSTMPRERGKPRRAGKNKNAYTRDKRLTASQ